MRLVLDAPLPKSLARHLVRLDHDAVRVIDVGLRGVSDQDLLLWAKDQGRAVVSRDADFLNDLHYRPELYAGIVVSRIADESPKATIAAIEPALAMLDDQFIIGKLAIIDEAGMRIREGLGADSDHPD